MVKAPRMGRTEGREDGRTDGRTDKRTRARKADPPTDRPTDRAGHGTMISGGGGGKDDDGENKGRKLRQAPRAPSVPPPPLFATHSYMAIYDET